MTVDWHSIWQDVLDDYLPLISGKEIETGGREFSRQIRLDYYCEVKDGKSKAASAPLGFLKKYNVLEFKGFNEGLTIGQLRYYVGRALVVEGMQARPSRIGRVALTVMTSKMPRNVLKHRKFKFEKVKPWLFRSRWVDNLDIYIIVLSEARGIDGGEGLAFLQVLEGNVRYRRESWDCIMRQNFNHARELESIMIKIDKEVSMSLADEYRREGEKRGEKKGEIKGEIKGEKKGERKGEIKAKRDTLQKLISLIPGSQKDQFEKALASATTIKQLVQLENQILPIITQSA